MVGVENSIGNAATVATSITARSGSLQLQLAEACKLLKTREESGEEHEDWMKRRDALASIPPILMSASQLANGSLDGLLQALVKPITSQLADLRSSIVRAATTLLDSLMSAHGKSVGVLAAGVMPQLLRNTYVSVKAISMASNETALKLVAAAPTFSLISVLLSWSHDSHHQARKGCAEGLPIAFNAGLTPSERQLSDTCKV